MPQPHRLPLTVSPGNRDQSTAKDARIVNGFVDQVDKEEVWLYKRPGTSLYSSVPAAAGLGVYNWQGDIYTVFGSTLYKNGSSVGTGLDTSSSYTFSSNLGSSPTLFLQNGTAAYNYNTSSGLVKVTDANYPVATVKGSAYLDGTTYVMTPAALVQGSNINDSSTYGALNNLLAQIEPDSGVRLAKQLVYIIAFKQWTTEVFYDAGNASGSPLGPVQGAKVNYGCRHQDTVQELEGMLFWVSATRTGSVAVMVMSDLKASQVSTPAIERLLQQADFTGPVYSWTAKVSGHRWYVLTVVNSNLTIVYDSTSKHWYQWSDSSGNYMPFSGATFTSTQQVLLQHCSDGKVYSFDPTVYTDSGSPIVLDLYTPPFEGGTRQKKYVHSMDFVGDQTRGSILQVSSSDDDYQTWSNYRSVDMGKSRPRLVQGGTFRRRAYHVRHMSPTPLRIQSIELFLEVGTL